jgi:hypothetical protein
MKAVIKVTGDYKQEYLLGKVNTLGRALDNTIMILDRMISDHHAEIRQIPNGRYEITDLDSTHGTFVGKNRVTRHVLAEGDEIILGATRLIFRQASAEDSTRRWAERFPCDLPVRVEVRPGEEIDTRATVISLKGLKLDLDHPLAPESIVALAIALPGAGEPLRVRARVVHANEGKSGIGLAFLFDSEESQAKLTEAIRRMMLTTDPAP